MMTDYSDKLIVGNHPFGAPAYYHPRLRLRGWGTLPACYGHTHHRRV